MLLRRPAETDRNRLLFLHQVTTRLAEAGLPVPAAVPARGGRPFVTVERERYVLRPWIDGDRRAGCELSIDQCRELGRLLGSVHAELDALTPPVQQSLFIPVRRARDTIALAERWYAAETDARVREALAARRELLSELADHQPPEVEAVVAGYVHGDFQEANLRYGRTGAVVAILGWGGVRIASFAGEVVNAAAALFERPDGEALDLDRAEALVEGHASVFPLDGAQLRSAAHRIWWERLCDLGPEPVPPMPDGLQGEGTGSAPGERLLRTAGLVTWWTAQLEPTLEAFAAPYERPVEEPADEDTDQAARVEVIDGEILDAGGIDGEAIDGGETDPEFWDAEPQVWDAGTEVWDVDVDVEADIDLSLV
jgi:hypothetical protein